MSHNDTDHSYHLWYYLTLIGLLYFLNMSEHFHYGRLPFRLFIESIKVALYFAHRICFDKQFLDLFHMFFDEVFLEIILALPHVFQYVVHWN
jgi:hypothetical protein